MFLSTLAPEVSCGVISPFEKKGEKKECAA
jgi:hypothetical protein